MAIRNTSQPKLDRRAGFSLVELMVAVVVMAIVTSQLLLSFSEQHTTSMEHERTIEIQEEARLVTDVILKDLRSGGFMVPKFAAVASNDGGAATTDALCVSDSTIVDATTLPGASTKFGGARVVGPVVGNAGSVTVATSTLDVDSDGDDDFVIGNGIILAAGFESHCAQLIGRTNSGTNTILSFSPNTIAGFNAAADDVVVPAIRYSLVVATGTLSRNSTVLSNNIEDIQTEFGVDVDRDGTIQNIGATVEFPIDILDGEEYELVRNVRVHVTAREARPEPLFAGQFPAIANRVAGAADNFKRRRVTGDALLRNLR